ncbi:BRCT domain-containing protein [Defluviimonas sp. WL0050]|uniref:BRCT domain-containing protein n=1 Tax=Albidovulum litorale TaxID=2984134 RepID=A0ABT2ZQY6_9RHOB|nr:BRCT domain-containing protein [Defluviimonas sp. WL0050]MCV2873457.1 BRCT domain-containing protein [Defluviimonas sp. WL0050]
MSELEHNGPELARIHRQRNDRKFFCYFTGFLEGIAASGYLERGEIAPLIAECKEFVTRVADGDASDLLQDLDADLLDHENVLGIVEVRVAEIDGSCEKSGVNRFLGFCRGIACDGTITEREAAAILDRINANPVLSQIVGVRQIRICCEDALADSILTAGESSEICEAIGQIVGDCYGDTGLSQPFGVANYGEFRLSSIESDFEGRTIVLTGTFKTNPRSLLEEKLEEFGAQISRNVSGKTDFLIVGGEAARDWIEMNRGTKIRKAQELRLRSELPRFISENQVMKLLG